MIDILHRLFLVYLAFFTIDFCLCSAESVFDALSFTLEPLRMDSMAKYALMTRGEAHSFLR